MTKSTKSQQGGLTPSSLRTSVRRARVSRASNAWRVPYGTGQSKNQQFRALRNLTYTTRANISHEKTEQIRARIACTPAEKYVAGVDGVSTLTKARIFASLLQWEKVARFTATDEVLL